METANETVARPECQTVPDQSPQDGNNGHHGKALHHGSQHILLAHQSAVEEGQAGPGHQEN